MTIPNFNETVSSRLVPDLPSVQDRHGTGISVVIQVPAAGCAFSSASGLEAAD